MNLEVNMNKINSVEKIISKILVENDFNKMDVLVDRNKQNVNNKFIFPNGKGINNSKFVSVKYSSLKPFIKIMTEADFYKIVGVTKKGLSKRSGRYQEYLYSNYLYALKSKDEGYISDILYKALDFQTNLNYVKELMKDKKFLKEWRKDFGNESALELFKNRGDLKIINIIKERTNF